MEQGKLVEGEYVRYFGVILILLTVSSASFAGGEPGCLRLVGSRSLSPAQVKMLPNPCGNFHKNYSNAVHLLASDPKAFSAWIKKTISDAEKSGSLKTPYDAILLAVLTKDNSVTESIQKYSDFEKKKDVLFKYASAAIEKKKTGSCKNFTLPAYEEICFSSDQVLNRLVALNQPITGHKK